MNLPNHLKEYGVSDLGPSREPNEILCDPADQAIFDNEPT